MQRVVLGLGGNLGDSLEVLLGAAEALASRLRSPRLASPWRSPPHPGSPPQGDFANTVLLGDSSGTGLEWLAIAKALELGAGRRPTVRWGPRPLDIDVLLVGDQRVDSERLRLPHPGLAERSFVLAPLAELEPELVPPGLADSVATLLASLPPSPLEQLAWRRRPLLAATGW